MDKEPHIDISQIPGISDIKIHTELDGKTISDEIQKSMSGINKLSRNIGYPVTFTGTVPPDEPVQQPAQHNGYGVSVGMLFWSLAFLLFPKYATFPLWIADVFYVIGFVALLIGILGLSIEVFKGKS